MARAPSPTRFSVSQYKKRHLPSSSHTHYIYTQNCREMKTYRDNEGGGDQAHGGNFASFTALRREVLEIILEGARNPGRGTGLEAKGCRNRGRLQRRGEGALLQRGLNERRSQPRGKRSSHSLLYTQALSCCVRALPCVRLCGLLCLEDLCVTAREEISYLPLCWLALVHAFCGCVALTG